MKSLIWEDRGQILKVRAVLHNTRRIAVDRLYIEKCRKFLCRGFHSPTSSDDIAGLHVKAADLGRCHIDIVISRKEVLTADKSEAIRHDL